MKLKLALLAAAGSVAMISGAHAQERTGYYGAIGAGVALSNDSNDLEGDSATPAAFDTEFDLDTNVALYGAIGRYFQHGLRGEVELATRSQEIDALPGDGLGFAGFPANGTLGDLSATTLMVNVLKDFDLDAAGRLNPYVGVGAGVARIRPEFDNLGTGVAALGIDDMATSNEIVVGDVDYVPAVQGLAGLTFDFTENMMIDVRYKYLQTAEFDFGGYVNTPLTELTGEYTSHEVTAGFRWNFGPVSAPAPAPAPVQYTTCFDGSQVPVTETCPPEVDVDEVAEIDPLIVYFDFAKSSLTDAASTLIAARAEEALDANVASVTVAGHTDTVGSAASNLRLSNRRSAAVREALIANGIDADAITVEGYGQSQPARQTPDGTKEPLNRRAEVTFGF